MQRNTGNFLCKLIARKIHHFFFSFTLVLLFSVASAHAAGYSCPTYKKYTSCNAGYYMTASSDSTEFDASQEVGNACIACSNAGSGCTCAGDTAAPVCTVTVTFKSGSTTLGTQTLTNGVAGTLTAVSNFTAPVSSTYGWTFAGWATSANSTTVAHTDAASVTFTADTTLYGVWRRSTYFYYYSSATATTRTYVTRTQYYRNSSTTAAGVTSVTMPALTTQTAYAWAPAGWVRGSTTSTSKYSSSTTAVSVSPTAGASQYFYALYSRTATISYNGNGANSGSTTSTTATQYYNTGNISSAVALNMTVATSGFTRKGCSFNGWGTSASATTVFAEVGSTVTFPLTAWASTSTATLYAIWSCMTVSASAKSLTYNGTTTSNGTAQSCATTFTVSGPSSYTVTYSTSSTGTFGSTAPTLTNVGSTTVYYKVAATDYTAYEGRYTCTMNSKAMTVSASNKSKVYDGSALSCSISVSVPSSGATIKYGTSSGSYTLTSAPTQTNVGSQTVYYQVTGSNFTTKTGSFTCSVTKATMDASLAGNSKTYDGAALTCNGGTQTGVPSGSTITYGASTSSYSSTIPTVTNVADSKTIYYKITNSNYNDFTGSFSCTVNKAAGTTTVSKTSMTLTYPTTTGTFTASCSESGAPTATSNATSTATVSISSGTATVTWKAAGSATITVSCPATTNYNASSKTVAVTIAKGANPITLSASSGTITYPNSGTFTVSAAQGTLSVSSGTTSVATASVSGTTVTMTSVKPGSSTITVTAAGNSYYLSGSKTYALTVSKGTNPITLSASSGSINYNGTGTFTVSGAAGTLSVSSASTTIATASLSSTTVTMTGKQAGSTTITVTAAGNDYYNSGSKNYSLTVNKIAGTTTVSKTSMTLTYPTTTGTFTASCSESGAPTATSNATSTATVSISSGTATVTWKAAGSATITVSCPATTNYNASSKTVAVTIAKGANTLTLSATSGTLTYNASTKTKTFTVSKNTSGGTLSVSSNATGVATASISGSTVTATYVKVGSATITVSSAATSYYNAASATYALTINCGAGYYSNSAACTICPIGKYTSTANTASSCTNVNAGCYADATGSTTACPKSCSSLGGGLYVNSVAGSDSENDCYFTTTGGKYMVASTDTAQTTCPAKQYCTAETLYYPNVSVLNDGGWNDCPAISGRTMTSFPDNYKAYAADETTVLSSSVSIASCSLQSWTTGVSSVGYCRAVCSFTNEAGRVSDESIRYNTSTGKYDIASGSQYYTVVNPGYWVNTRYSSTYCDNRTETSTQKTLYKKAMVCPAGSYCPGYTTFPRCYGNEYPEEGIGKYGCSDNTGGNYENSAQKSSSVNACYLTTTAGKFVKTANSGEEACTCGGYCPGSVSVNYGSTGGKTDCGAGTYNNATSSSASSACKTTSAGYYAVAGACSQTQVDANCWGAAGSQVACPNSCASPYSTSAKGSDDANDCYLTTTAKNYVKTAGAGQTTCAAGTYCPGGSVIYKGGTVSGRATTGGSTTCSAGSFCVAGVSAGTKCVTGSYSEAGASACTACQDGKTTSATGQTSCNATCSNATGVSDWETASWATTNTMTNLCTVAATAGCSANYYKSSNACLTCSSGTNSKYTLSAAGTTSVNSCYLKTTAGKYVATKGAGETACVSPYYCTGGTTIYYGTGTTTGGNSTCTGLGAIYTASDASASVNTKCYATTSPGKYVTAKATAEAACPAGDWCAGSVKVYYGSAGGNTDCPSGYTNGTTGYSLQSQCLMSVAGGKYVATEYESSASGTCDKGYAKEAHTVNYGGTSSCSACTGATYAANTGQASCTPCPTAQNPSTDVVTGYGYWISGDIHTARSGCQAYFATETLDNGTANFYCFVDQGHDTYGIDGDNLACYVRSAGLTCNGGYYNDYFSKNTSASQKSYGKTLAGARENACTSVGEGYWSADESLTRTACDSGLTTIGYGTGANEAGDCGRKFHAGDNVIYLRSEKRGDTALNVKIGNQKFFGALSTTYSSPIKVKNGSTEYSVVNDWQ